MVHLVSAHMAPVIILKWLYPAYTLSDPVEIIISGIGESEWMDKQHWHEKMVKDFA